MSATDELENGINSITNLTVDEISLNLIDRIYLKGSLKK